MIERHPWGGLCDPAARGPADVAILGLPWDGAVCFRPGAAAAPARLRALSTSSPAISEDGFVVRAERLRVHDAGDIAPAAGQAESEAGRVAYLARVEARAGELLAAHEAGRRPFLFSIGGDHSVSIPLLRAFAAQSPQPFGLVLLDAHPDLFDSYAGSRLSHACPMRRALETGRLSPAHLLILGTRSYNETELDFMRAVGVRFVPARELARLGTEGALALARERLSGLSRVYLSLDIDVADPACAPGTGAPVAGGLSSRELLDLTRGLLESLPVTAMDLVEIAPALDPTEATAFLGLQLVFETLAVLARRQAA